MRKKKTGQVVFFPSGKPVPKWMQRELIYFEVIEIEIPPLWQDVGGLDLPPENDDGRAA